MPTKAHEAILDRELSKAEAKEVIDTVSPLLQELVNYATNALIRCSTSKSISVKEVEDRAILSLYRNIIELTDGIEVMLSQGCVIAAIPALRSSFEALLAITYILENNENYVRRSLAWIVGNLHNSIDMYERYDPSTKKGQDAKELFDDDREMTFLQRPIAPIEFINKKETEIQAQLARPHLQLIEEEYQRQITLQKSKKYIEWYSLFDGPRSLYQLTKRLGKGGSYVILYQPWSAIAHSESISFLARAKEGEYFIRRLRDIGKFREIANFSAVFLLRATRLILKKLRPGEEQGLKTWYIRDVQKLFLANLEAIQSNYQSMDYQS